MPPKWPHVITALQLPRTTEHSGTCGSRHTPGLEKGHSTSHYKGLREQQQQRATHLQVVASSPCQRQWHNRGSEHWLDDSAVKLKLDEMTLAIGVVDIRKVSQGSFKGLSPACYSEV